MLSLKNQISYPPIYYRVLFYLLAAHFLVSYGEPENLFQLLKLPFYYIALSGSLVIALITGEFVLWVTRYLDNTRPWFVSFSKRICLQLLWGVAVAILLTTILAAVYFKARGKNIMAEKYFTYDFAIVVCFILLLNSLYLIVVLVQNRRQLNRGRISNKEKPIAVAVNPYTDVVAIYPVGRGFIALLKNGESMIWTKTIEQSLSVLPQEEYFLINRSDIINRCIIAGYEPGESRRLKLVLRLPIAIPRVFVVSQRKAVEFKHWYKNEADI